MATKRHGYKAVIRGKIVSMRLNEEEYLRLRAGGLRAKRSVSAILRERVADLIGVEVVNVTSGSVVGGAV